MKTLYILLLINCLINAFVRRSKGSLFYDVRTKSLFQAIHTIVLIGLMIIATIKYSWLHIIYMFLVDFIAYIPFSFFLKKVIFKD